MCKAESGLFPDERAVVDGQVVISDDPVISHGGIQKRLEPEQGGVHRVDVRGRF